MQSIETTQIDQYAQTMLMDRNLDHQERATSAASAMAMHVFAEYGLPIGTTLPMSEEEQESMYWMEENLERITSAASQKIADDSMAAFDWMEDQHPESQAVDITRARLTSVSVVGPGEGFPGSYIELTQEGNTAHYGEESDQS